MFGVRPAFSVGQVIAGLPAISRVLHSEEQYELYELGGEPSCVLLVARRRPMLNEQKLEPWLKGQDQSIVKAAERVPDHVLPSDRIATVLKINGRCLDRVDLVDAREERLVKLLGAMLRSVERTRELGMFPDFAPGLVWESEDFGETSVLMPLSEPLSSEADQVRLLAQAFYRWATGIDPRLMAVSAPALKSWSKFAGEGLSRLVSRAIAPTTPREAITSFTAVAAALARLGLEPAETSQRSASEERARSLTPDAGGNGLAKVAGMHDLKALLTREVVEPLRNPGPYRQYGLTIPNGILLYGPPGCGKTYIARQLAEELGHHFIEVIPSELASPFIHQSVMRIREVFDAAADQSPTVVFIDEFEALAPARDGLGGHQHYKAEEVNEFLAHLNNCSERGIFVIAATNQPDHIDAAVKRTGRLDKLIYVGPPDLEARREMLALHLSGRLVDPALDVDALSNALAGYAASDIRFLVDEAAREAFRGKRQIDEDAFAAALARIAPSVTPEVEAIFRTMEQRGM